MLPVIEAFTAARRLPGVTVAAGAGMISGADMKATGAAGGVVHRGDEGP